MIDSETMGEYKRLNAGVEPVGGESILGGDQEERGGGVIHYFRNNIIHVRQRGASIKILFTSSFFSRKMYCFPKKIIPISENCREGGKTKAKQIPGWSPKYTRRLFTCFQKNLTLSSNFYSLKILFLQTVVDGAAWAIISILKTKCVWQSESNFKAKHLGKKRFMGVKTWQCALNNHDISVPL